MFKTRELSSSDGHVLLLRY